MTDRVASRLPARPRPRHQVFQADGGWEYTYGGPQGSPGKKSFETDPRQTQPAIDIHSQTARGGGWQGIYEVEGDTEPCTGT